MPKIGRNVKKGKKSPEKESNSLGNTKAGDVRNEVVALVGQKNDPDVIDQQNDLDKYLFDDDPTKPTEEHMRIAIAFVFFEQVQILSRLIRTPLEGSRWNND